MWDNVGSQNNFFRPFDHCALADRALADRAVVTILNKCINLFCRAKQCQEKNSDLLIVVTKADVRKSNSSKCGKHI